VFSAAFSPDSQRIVTGSEDRSARVWEVGTGKQVLTLSGHEAGITSVAFSPDGNRIALVVWISLWKFGMPLVDTQLLTLSHQRSNG
jgi:WD40 repeat protein